MGRTLVAHAVPTPLARSFVRFVRHASLAFAALVLVVLALWSANAMNDGTQVAHAVAASAGETGVLECRGGDIARQGDSIVDRLIGAGSFRCTDWHMRGLRVSPSGTVAWPSSPKR